MHIITIRRIVFLEFFLLLLTNQSQHLLINCLIGAVIAFLTISIPIHWSLFIPSIFNILETHNNALPPPPTPSWTLDLTALRASSTLSFFSLISDSVIPPTLITATPSESLDNLSYNFSFSYSDEHSSHCVFNCFTLFYLYFITKIINYYCESLDTIILPAYPNYLISHFQVFLQFFTKNFCTR